MTNSSMYRENILELWKNPMNFGTIQNPTAKCEKANVFCGDEITVSLIIENNIMKDIKFNGKGCAISIAAASLITDKIKEKSLDEIKKISMKDAVDLLEIDISPGRIKCATLCFEGILEALEDVRN